MSVPIRPASTVVLMRDTAAADGGLEIEVFLLQRVAQMEFAANMAVFPGGAVDPSDRDETLPWAGPSAHWWSRVLQVDAEEARALVAAAVRELFEETGVALISEPGRPVPTIDSSIEGKASAARADLTAHRTGLGTVLDAFGQQLRSDLLRPWARWITPEGSSRRYDTFFFVAALPAGQQADGSTPEATAGYWTSVRAALAAAEDNMLNLMPPTRRVLTELLPYRTVAEVMSATGIAGPETIIEGDRGGRLVAPRWQAEPDCHSVIASLAETSSLTKVRLAPNPGPMTLDGTNSYVITSAMANTVVVVDPGPLDPQHLAELAGGCRVELVLITHHHHDHTEASEEFHRMTGAPVRALDQAFCVAAEPLVPGEWIEAAGVRIQVVATPGHSADSVCFYLPDDGPNGSVLTGDTILGRGTTIIAFPDGRLQPYLQSLEILRELGSCTVLPAHGPVLPDLAKVCAEYREHRHQRLDQVRAAIEAITQSGQEISVAAVTDAVYFDIDDSVRFAAEKSVRAQLDYLLGAASG